jgi:hypothetical protein
MRSVVVVALSAILITCVGVFLLEPGDLSPRELPRPIVTKENPEDLKRDMEALFTEASKIETLYNDEKANGTKNTKNSLTPDMIKSVKVRVDLLYINDPSNAKAKILGDRTNSVCGRPSQSCRYTKQVREGFGGYNASCGQRHNNPCYREIVDHFGNQICFDEQTCCFSDCRRWTTPSKC